MLKTWFGQGCLLAAAWMFLAGAAFAAVDVNTADEAALTSIKGIGPATAKRVVEERNQHGPYKDAGDLAQRVSGVGPKSAARLEEAGLTFGAKAAVPAAKTAAAPAAPAAAPGKKSAAR
ncbi:ComEA family DNA-binding protein [Cupriavidus sp. TMH.W2]|uniref:ComEA family DNA-binding protein n=1 Tax=Cupriavidus sp. TMH.W2 TaxID=3434465 RepID=UPI003D76F243